MKKYIKCICAVLVVLGTSVNARGDVVTFNANIEVATETGKLNTYTKENVKVTTTAMDGGTYYKTNSSQTLKIESTNSKNITKIVIYTTDASTYSASNYSTGTGTYSASGAVGTWTGSATSITFSASPQARVLRIEVTDGNSHSGSTNPWFSVSPTSYSPADEDIENGEASWSSQTFTVTKWTAPSGDNIYLKITDISNDNFWFSIYNQSNSQIWNDGYGDTPGFLVNHSEGESPTSYRFTLYCGVYSTTTASCTANLVIFDYVRGGEITIPISLRAVASCIGYDITIDNTGTGSTYVSPSACEDETVTFTATPGTGYEYSGATVTGENTDIELNSSQKSFTMPAEEVAIYVTFSAKYYDVTLNPNGGSGSNQTVSARYDYAMPLVVKTAGTAIVVPTKTGYDFGGYWTSSAATGGTQYYSYTSSTLGSAKNWDKANNSTTLYARWTAKTTTITLDKGDGSNNGEASVKYDATALTSISHATAATGYHITGYYTNDATPVKVLNDDGSFAASNVTGYVTSGAWSNTSSAITLYAHYAADVYTIVYKDQGNVAFSGEHESGYPTTHTYGTATTLYDATKTGYTFGGWYGNSSCTGDEVTSLGATAYTSAPTLYAKWTAKNITLTLDGNGGTSDGSGSVTFDGTNATISSAPVYGTKTISGYYAAADGDKKVLNDDGTFAATNVEDFIVGGKWKVEDSPTTLYAHWVTDNKVVTFNLHGHGGDNFTQNVENGQKAIRPSDPVDVDYNFDDWYTDDGGDPSNTKFDFANTTITAATTIHAKWTAKTYSKLVFACVDISVASHDDGKAYITSRNGVNIMAPRPIKVTVEGAISGHVVDITSDAGLKFYRKITDSPAHYVLLTGSNRLVAPLDEQEVYVSYNPTSDGSGAILTPTFTISCDGESQEFNSTGAYVKVRNLPATAAIVAKVGNTWHALSANIASSSTPLDEQIFTSVEDGVLTAHGSTTELGYKLWPVKTTGGSADRFGTYSSPAAVYADRLRFAGKSDKGLWANDLGSASSSKYNINNYATIDATDDDGAAPYEWKVTTTEVDGQFVYTLQTDQTNNQKYLRMYNGRWGTYADGKGVDSLYMLPLVAADLVEMEPYEWGETELAVTYTPGATPVALTKVVVGETTINAPTATLTNLGGDIWKIGGLCDLKATPAEPMVVWLTENGSAKQAMLQVPFIVTSTKTEQALRTSVGNKASVYRNVDVVIRNGGKLTTEYDLGHFANLYIYPGGKALISNNMTLNNIYMRGGYSVLNSPISGTYRYPDLCITNGTISTEGVDYDLFVDNRLYYIFSMPYDVSLSDVHDESGSDEFDVWVKHYNGSLRASGQKVNGWDWYGDNPITQHSFFGGVGYEITAKPRVSGRPLAIIRFPVKSGDVESDEDHTASVTVGNWGYSAYTAGTQTANNVGWNLVGNPYLTEFKAVSDTSLMVTGDLVQSDSDPWDGTYKWDTKPIRFITVPYDLATDYHHERVKDYAIPAFSAFFIQTTTAGKFTMGGTRTQAAVPIRLSLQQLMEPEICVDLMLRGEGESVEGKAGLIVHETYDGAYHDFEDVEQWFGSANLLKTYTIVGGTALAYNLLDQQTAETWIPVGYVANVGSKHTYALSEQNDLSRIEHVWLTDYEAGSTTDLLDRDYEFTTAAGRNDTRFAISIVFKQPGTTTDIDAVINDKGDETRKFIYHDKMYILHQGIIYDATGKKVQEINK